MCPRQVTLASRFRSTSLCLPDISWHRIWLSRMTPIESASALFRGALSLGLKLLSKIVNTFLQQHASEPIMSNLILKMRCNVASGTSRNREYQAASGFRRGRRPPFRYRYRSWPSPRMFLVPRNFTFVILRHFDVEGFLRRSCRLFRFLFLLVFGCHCGLLLCRFFGCILSERAN